YTLRAPASTGAPHPEGHGYPGPTGPSARGGIDRRAAEASEVDREPRPRRFCIRAKEVRMSTVTTKDGVTIFYKDWGPKNAQPIVFHHGWPLSADDWDTQMLYFLG